ncbi:hypothetical protein [Shinella zoogloeoides]|uniref:hypothetical protein n=1 Tax=Shinella zoogloeoides TaxID=352475 RepID=UPI00299E14A8|nr:hypothetical protein [Shinella zoogloeoides]WPE19861.1 hypothetical protein ShzoTeo12_10370 [Shinella zoogloeoides]
MEHAPIEAMLENSYRNFHVKGFDYLCLFRTPEWTRKVYFFEGDLTRLPEIVNPHDHRYDFDTTVITGAISNSYYSEDPAGDVYEEFEWRTPLLGGDGFLWKRETRLLEEQRFVLRRGQSYRMTTDQLHTIRMHADRTIILLDQWADKVPAELPTRTFMHTKSAPQTTGLYDRFTADQLMARLSQYEEAAVGLNDMVAA